MTMVLAVGLGSSGCDLSGGSKFETITDAGISNAEEIDVCNDVGNLPVSLYCAI